MARKLIVKKVGADAIGVHCLMIIAHGMFCLSLTGDGSGFRYLIGK